jgi:hypothetical protein
LSRITGDHLAGRHRALDRAQEAEELLVAVARHAAPDDRAVEHAERREQVVVPCRL